MVLVNGLNTTSTLENQTPHTGGARRPCAQTIVKALTWHARQAADVFHSKCVPKLFEMFLHFVVSIYINVYTFVLFRKYVNCNTV